ncbi:MAG: hypothetical protein ABIN18_14435 [Pseudomonadota bacterium]
MEQSYRALAKGTFGGGAITNPNALSLRYMTPKSDKPKLIFKLGVDVLKKAKIAIKDRVDFIVDTEVGKAFIRADQEGWKINPVGDGKSGAGYFELPWNSQKLFQFNNKQAVDVPWTWTAKTGIAFDIPSESVEAA